MKNFTRLLFLLALLVAAGNMNAYAQLSKSQLEGMVGKTFTLLCRYYTDTSGGFYLVGNPNSSDIGLVSAADISEDGMTEFYYWTLYSQEKDGKTWYYFSNYGGGGNIARGWNQRRADPNKGKYVLNQPILSGNSNRLMLFRFSDNSYKNAVKGVNLVFENDINNLERPSDDAEPKYGKNNPGDSNDPALRLLVIHKDGCGHTSESPFNFSTPTSDGNAKSQGTEWINNFVIKEVHPVQRVSYDLTFYRTLNDSATVDKSGKYESGYLYNVDYNYYATLNLTNPVLLPKEFTETNGEIYAIESPYADFEDNSVKLCSIKKSLLYGQFESTKDKDSHYLLPANTPVLLMLPGENGDSRTELTKKIWNYAGSDAPGSITTGFTGTSAQGEKLKELHNNKSDVTYYILSRKGGVVAFYYLENDTIRGNKAYFKYNNTNRTASSSLNFFVGDAGATAIDKVEAAPAPGSPAPIYDLTGRRVSSPVKGSLYIRGGRKFIRK